MCLSHIGMHARVVSQNKDEETVSMLARRMELGLSPVFGMWLSSLLSWLKNNKLKEM